MKRILIGFLLLMGGWSPLFAQNFSTASLTTAGVAPACGTTACLTLDVNQNVGGATFTLSGTWSGTISFYGSGDGGVTLVALTVYPSNSTTGVTTATGNGTWQVNPAGYTNLYAIFTTATSGTVVATIRSSVASARAGGGGGGGGTGCVPSGSANYVLLDSGSGACNTSTTASDSGTAFAYTGTGGVTSPKYTAGTDNSAAGTLQLANGSANAHTIFSSGATTTNTIAGFTVVPTTGDLVDCVVSSTTCTLTDAGVLTANVVTDTGTLTSGQVAYGGGTKTITSSANMTFSTAALTLGVSGTAGTLLTFPASGNFTTTWGSAATASNTILGFATAPTTGDLVDCVVSSTTCTLTDAGVLAASIVTGPASATNHGLATFNGTGGKTLESSNTQFTVSATNLTAGSTGVLDLSGATGTAALKVPTTTTNTATAAGVIDYDTTNSNYHAYSGADSLVAVVPTASIPNTGHLLNALVSGGQFLLQDSGIAKTNVVNAGSPGAGVAHFAGSTQTVTSSAVTPADATGNTTGSGNFVLVTSPTLVTPTLGAASATSVSSAAYLTATKCAATGTAASPSVVSCSAAPSGSFSCATNASTATCVIDDTIVTANSAIFIQPSAAAGTLLSVTCNTTADTGLTAPRLASISASTSFTINLGTFGTNPLCFNFFIIN